LQHLASGEPSHPTLESELRRVGGGQSQRSDRRESDAADPIFVRQ
jgi:hypothetical protein